MSQMRSGVGRHRLIRAFLFPLALSLLILASEQFISYRMTGSTLTLVTVAAYYLPPLFALSFAIYTVASLLGLWATPIRRFAIIMGVLVAYLLSIVLPLALAVSGNRPTYLSGAVFMVGGFWAVTGVRNRPLWPVASVAAAILHLGVAHTWLAVNPEKVLQTYPIVAFSLQGLAVGFLFVGCVWLCLVSGYSRLPRYAIGLAICVLLSLSIVSEPLRWKSTSHPRLDRSHQQPLSQEFPNLLWIVFDTLRKDHLPVYGYERNTTPFLSELVLESMVYYNVISTAGWTLPSHASMFTGLYSREHGAHRSGTGYSRLDEGKITLAEILQAAGYRTGAFSANNGFVQPATGLAQGFDSFSNFEPLPIRMARLNLIQLWIDLMGRDGSEDLLVPYVTAREVTGAALEWVDDQGQSPWFLFLNYMEAHRPRHPTPSRRDLFPGRISAAFRLPDRRAASTGDAFTREELADLNSQYDAQIRTLDYQLMVLIQTLRKRNQLENTVVVITSDHGEYLGEHDMISHGAGLYKELLQVPLIVRSPRGKTVGGEHRLISMVEIPAIALAEIPLDRLDLDPDHRAHVERLYRRHQGWENGFVVSELHLNEKFPDILHSGGIVIHEDGFKFIATHRGEELYDLTNDPQELTNVRRLHLQKAIEMRRSLERFEQTVSEYLGPSAFLDSSADVEALKALGYIETE